MPSFTETLASLPSIEHLAAIGIYRDGNQIDSIPNQDGKRGSLTVYHALYQRFAGQLDANAAAAGLALFCEHTEDARRNPGKHPNIDRLLQVIAENSPLQLHPISREGDHS